MVDVNVGVLVILAFLALVLLRVPVFVALLVPAMSYILVFDLPLLLASQRMVRMMNNYTLLAIPLFIFVGSLMNHGKITDHVFEFANSVVGHISGGLAQVNIFASLIFSGMSGAALADIGGIGRVEIKAMQDQGYDSDYAAALTSASATVGPIFPPSVPIVIFGLVAEVSVLNLLLAGIIPAVLTVLLLMVSTHVIAKIKQFPSTDSRAPGKRIGYTFYKAFPAIMAPFVLIGGMLSGYFGPTEAAAVTVAYILVVNVVFYRVTDFRYIWDAAHETVRTAGSIVIILAAASLFAWVLSVENVADLFMAYIFSISSNPIVILLVINAILIVLGLFLEPVAALIMSIPIVVPPLIQIGVDPVHIGIIMVFNLMLGLLTPPLGLSVFLSSDIANTSAARVFNELKGYYIVLLFCLLIITYIPALSLTIPNGF